MQLKSPLSYLAHETGTLPLRFQCALEACAPEVVFARVIEQVDNPPIEPPADIWALGASVSLHVFIYMIFEVIDLWIDIRNCHGIFPLPRRGYEGPATIYGRHVHESASGMENLVG